MIEVTGYLLKQALNNWKAERDAHASRFKDTLFQFEDSNLGSPTSVVTAFQLADNAVAQLEEAQQEYNLKVFVKFGDEQISLSRAVKLVGGAGRIEKMWKSSIKTEDRYGYATRELTRKTDEISAKRQISVEDSITMSKNAARRASELRSRIAEGNSTKVRVNLNPELLKALD